MEQENYYEILGVDRYASQTEIKKAYIQLAREYHPDKVSSLGRDSQLLATKKMEVINMAYSTLSDQEEKIKYDEKISRRGGTRTLKREGTRSGASGAQPRAGASKSERLREQSRAEMMMETSMFRVRDKIKTEVPLSWQSERDNNFTVSLFAKTFMKRYYVYIKTYLVITPKDFTSLMMTIRSNENQTKGGFSGKESMYVVAFQGADQGAKIEDLWRQFNAENDPKSKGKRYIALLNIATGSRLLPDEIRDKNMSLVASKINLGR